MPEGSTASRRMKIALMVGLWVVPGGFVLGIVMSGIYGAHGLGFVVVCGGVLGMIGAVVNGLAALVPRIRTMRWGSRMTIVFAGAFGLCAVAVQSLFGIPRVADLASLGVAILAISAATTRVA
jgi:hypothetical protein